MRGPACPWGSRTVTVTCKGQHSPGLSLPDNKAAGQPPPGADTSGAAAGTSLPQFPSPVWEGDQEAVIMPGRVCETRVSAPGSLPDRAADTGGHIFLTLDSQPLNVLPDVSLRPHGRSREWPAWTAVTTHHGLCGLDNRYSFLTVLGAVKSRIVVLADLKLGEGSLPGLQMAPSH